MIKTFLPAEETEIIKPIHINIKLLSEVHENLCVCVLIKANKAGLWASLSSSLSHNLVATNSQKGANRG